MYKYKLNKYIFIYVYMCIYSGFFSILFDVCSLILFGKDICKYYDILADISKDLIWLLFGYSSGKVFGGGEAQRAGEIVFE